MDYTIPRASDIPFIKFSYNEILCKTNPLGIKGAGEAGAIGAPPAIINAICDALDIDHLDMPAKPEKVWSIISFKKAFLNKKFTRQMLLPIPLVAAFEYSVALFSKKFVCSTAFNISSIR